MTLGLISKGCDLRMSAYTQTWLADTEILNCLCKCQQEGMVILIFAFGLSKRDLPDILYLYVLYILVIHTPGQCVSFN